MPREAIPPWHMWGNEIDVHLESTGGPFNLDTQQLFNINYARPETWTWLMWYRVTGCSNPGGVGVVQVRFNLTLGIGRTKLQANNFVVYLTAALPIIGTQEYTTTTTDSATRIISDLPGQDIIASVNCVLTGGAAPGTTVDLAVGAMFAPKTHVRPEWYEGDFRGGEDTGR